MSYNHGMSDMSSFQSVFEACMGSDLLVGAGVVLGSCILFIFKSVRNAGKTVVEAVKNLGEKKQHIYSEKMNRLNTDIEAALMQIGMLTQAARVSVWQFHNGEVFTLSKPVFKIRSSFEYDRPGTTPDYTVINDVLVTQCLPLVGPLIDSAYNKTEGVSVVPVNTDELPDGDEHRIVKLDLHDLSYGAFRYMMDSLGTETVYAVLLLTAAKEAFGVITIQFIGSDDPEVSFEPNATKICPLLSRIRFALDNTRR